MGERLNIETITPETEEWTCKVQVVDKGRPRDKKDKTKKYRLMILQDEEENQVLAILFNSDIGRFAELFEPFHTYLVSVAQVKESNYGYGDPINKYTWTIDSSTIVEPIEKVFPPEAPLPPPTRLTITPFDAFAHQKIKESEFDVLAIVVNGEPPKYASNGKKIQDFIIMDNQKKPTRLTLWEDFVDVDGAKIFKKLTEYPVILAKRITRSASGLSNRYSTTIHINPPYPQADAMSNWSKTIKQMLSEYSLRSISASGSLMLVPFEEEIISIAEIPQQPPGKLFHIEGEISLVNSSQRFCSLACSNCKQLFTRTTIPREIVCSSCRQNTLLIPRCYFEVTVADKSGTAVAIISDEPAQKLLSLPLDEIYNTCVVKKQLLPFEIVNNQLSDKTFKIKMKKLFSKTTNTATGKLSIESYIEQGNAQHSLSTSATMEIAERSKHKFGDVRTSEMEHKNPVNKTNPSCSKDKIEKEP